jgi:hypothetical protein
MIEHIQSAMFDQVDSRKLHDLSNLCFILTVVTLGLALLAHGFGILRTLHPHGQTVSEKLAAIRAKEDLLLVNFLDIEEFERKRSLRPVMVLPAEDPDELHQDPNIVLLFV